MYVYGYIYIYISIYLHRERDTRKARNLDDERAHLGVPPGEVLEQQDRVVRIITFYYTLTCCHCPSTSRYDAGNISLLHADMLSMSLYIEAGC